MNPHSAKSISLISLFQNTINNSHLIYQIAKRDVIGRYRGSFMGLAWSFFYPLIMLLVYTFVFSVVFKAKWGVEDEAGRASFAVIFFTGMIVHALFSEIITRAPSIILQNSNYVKRVVFPLEALILSLTLSAVFHMFISVVVLVMAIVFVSGDFHWTMLFFPLVITPLVLFSLGVGWFLAALGVYVRDVGQISGVVSTILLFVSPVFFPLSAIPEQFQRLVMFNPLTFIIEQSRAVLLFGKHPDLLGVGVYMIVSIFVMWMGYAWFQKTRKGFSDVL